MSRRIKQASVYQPDEEYRDIAARNKQIAERIAKKEQPTCPHCGQQEFSKAGKTRGKFSEPRQRWKCDNCERSMVEDDRRYGNVVTESMLWEQAVLAMVSDPSGKTFRAVARKADEVGEEYFFNWKNSTVRRFFLGALNGRD